MEPLENKPHVKARTAPPTGGNAQPGGAQASSVPEAAGLELILDVPLEISVELGHAKMLVNDLLKLHQGSVIELSKIAGDTLDIKANQRMIARGEVVVTNEKYGVRLTEVVTPAERVERLR